MYLSLFLLLVLIGLGLLGIGLSIYRLVPAFGSWYSMELSKNETRIEFRRVCTILILLLFKMTFIHEVYKNFNWLLFILVSVVSVLVLFLIYILDAKSFQIGFKTGVYPKRKGTISRILNLFTIFTFNKATSENDNSILVVKEKVTFSDSNENVSIVNERKRNIQSTFTSPLFTLLRKYEYILLDDDFDYQKVKAIIINSEESVFRFKNLHEAKMFYNLVFDYSNSKLEDYIRIFGYEYNSFKYDPKEHKFSSKFKEFLMELEDLKFKKNNM